MKLCGFLSVLVFGLGHAAPIKPVCPFYQRIYSGLIAKRAIRTTFIVFDTPAFQDNARLTQIAEEFAIKAFITQLVVKAFNIPVLPRAPRLDESILISWSFAKVLGCSLSNIAGK